MSNAGNAKLKSVSRLIGRMKTLHVKVQQDQDAEIVPKYGRTLSPTVSHITFTYTTSLKSAAEARKSQDSAFGASLD